MRNTLGVEIKIDLIILDGIEFPESPEFKNDLKTLDNLIFNTRVTCIIKEHVGLGNEVLAS